MGNDLVKIGASKGKIAESAVSRRDFLKIAGVGSAAALTGCADPLEERVFPNVKGEPDRIPGVAVWYSSTCTECTAGCGIQARTRDGRTVKVEGNPDSPVNRGGLCALGQASLQSLYDPDRVRQPLKKGSNGWSPVSWDEAFSMIADALKKNGKKALLTGETSGALDELAGDWSKAFGVDRVVWDPIQPVGQAKASEILYGTYGVPEYHFDKAEVILNFGADFLETWVSPCGYARDWSKSRKSAKPAKFIHVEPRLSLTGASADLWLSAAPGTEVVMALGILRYVLEKGRGSNLSEDILRHAKEISKSYDPDKTAEITGVKKEKLLLVAESLSSAKSSLVIAGGTASSTADPVPLHAVVGFINHALENVGNTVDLGKMRKPQSSLAKLEKLSQTMKAGDLGLLVIHGSNPVFSSPASVAFGYSIKAVPLVVSFSSHIDDTAEQAHLILPPNVGLESWGDSRFVPGVYGLIQPTMKPIFDTKDFGECLLKIASLAGNTAVAGGAESYLDYLRNSWKKLYQGLGKSGDFDHFWLESLERGGYYEASAEGERPKVKFASTAFDVKFAAPKFDESGATNGLMVFPFPSVKSFDGRAANRPWLQELPDPITQIAWDAWAELNPQTAKERGIVQGDLVTVRNGNGEVNVPAFVTDFVHPGIVAIPLGQGHQNYGRYAKQLGGANAYKLASASNANGSDAMPIFSAMAAVVRAAGKSGMVIRQGSNSQQGRDLARTKIIDTSASEHHAEGHGEHHAEGHGELKQMYDQRVHPIYQWGLAVDLAACTGCSACVVACYAENNIPVVGKKISSQNREMSWLRIERYYDQEHSEELHVSFLPMMCQQCGNAPCEPVCPVYATYHNEEGLNSMAYNRCVGTRYCSNNCSYKVRRFNWFEYKWPEVADMQLNPDVTPRVVGVMEKCTFCVQRIVEGKDRAKDLGRLVQDGDVKPACVQSCPTQALTFGNLKDPNSAVSKLSHDERAYKVLDHHINTQPSVSYLEDVKVKI